MVHSKRYNSTYRTFSDVLNKKFLVFHSRSARSFKNRGSAAAAAFLASPTHASHSFGPSSGPAAAHSAAPGIRSSAPGCGCEAPAPWLLLPLQLPWSLLLCATETGLPLGPASACPRLAALPLCADPL